MDILNPAPEAVAGHPIHAGPREVAVPGRPSFLFKRCDGRTWENHFVVTPDDSGERGL